MPAWCLEYPGGCHLDGLTPSKNWRTIARLGVPASFGGGVSDDFPLARMYALIRTLRLADGPDEVHRNQLGQLELRRHAARGPVPPRAVYAPEW